MTKRIDNDIYKPEFVKDLFNKMSRTYERMNYITSFGFSIRWRRQSLDFFKKTEKEVEVLDLMCGMGETWDFIINRFPNASITAADFSTEMLKKAETKNQKKFGGKVELINEDFLKNNLPSNYYDYVICAYGLKTFDEEQLNFLAAELNRILKPNGYFSFIEVSKPENPFLKMSYQFYLKNVIPILGRLFLGNPEQYKMLWHYTENFENANQSYHIFLKNGLQANYIKYFYGCASGIFGTK